VLDRLGLTDRHVAKSESVRPGLVAHAKAATRAYAREQGVDLWAVDPVHLLFAARDPNLANSLVALHRSGRDVHFAQLGGRVVLVAELLQGLPHARTRFPALDWQSTRDRTAVRKTVQRLLALSASR
jgi:hypothetical protein